MKWQENPKSYREHTMSSTSKGARKETTTEFIAPDRAHIINTQIEGQPHVTEETFVIGNQVFQKSSDGQWTKTSAEKGDTPPSIEKKMIDEIMKSTDVKFVGMDPLDGVPMKLYQFTTMNPRGFQLTVTGKAWISNTDGILRKIETEGDSAGLKVKTTDVFSDYNSNIKIEAPAISGH